MFTGHNSAHPRLVSQVRKFQQHNVQTSYTEFRSCVCVCVCVCVCARACVRARVRVDTTSFCALGNIAFTEPVFTKLAITQQIFVCTISAEFLPNRTRNVEDSDKISFTPLDKLPFSPHLFPLHLCFLNDVYGHFLCRISPQIGHEIRAD
jgi:hypothetical protein